MGENKDIEKLKLLDSTIRDLASNILFEKNKIRQLLAFSDKRIHQTRVEFLQNMDQEIKIEIVGYVEFTRDNFNKIELVDIYLNNGFLEKDTIRWSSLATLGKENDIYLKSSRAMGMFELVKKELSSYLTQDTRFKFEIDGQIEEKDKINKTFKEVEILMHE